MKTLIAMLLTLTTLQAVAEQVQTKIPGRIKRLPELCQLQTDFSENFFEKQVMNIDTLKSLSPELMSLLKIYIQDDSMTLEQIKKEYSDLYITLLRHRVSGKQYIYVNGYPGDNESGLYFHAVTHEIMAENGDGDITLNTNQGSISCYDLVKE